MIHHQVLIIGGGPAGAACAERLVSSGVDCAVLDRESFPRQKTCAGWITPQVLDWLGIQPGDYPHQLTRFPALQVYLKNIPLRLPGAQYAVRRLEFDAWLLARSGAELIEHEARQIQKTDQGFMIDGIYRAEYLVGAGGTHCPVRRHFFGGKEDRTGPRIVALEAEHQADWQDPVCRLWFFRNRLPGYAWYVPKAGGYLNIGVGGSADALRARGSSIQEHWGSLLDRLLAAGLIGSNDCQPRGYVYHLRGTQDRVQSGKAYLAGDAAGLATLDMGEGIGPAIRSGQLAAESIIHRTPYSVGEISRYSLLPRALRWLVRQRT